MLFTTNPEASESSTFLTHTGVDAKWVKRMAYDPHKRSAECPDSDATTEKAIEVEFAIPTLLTQDQQRRLLDLLDEIVRSPWNQPEEGVHWVSGTGSKPVWSQADATFLGKPANPDAPLSGEPEFQDDVLHVCTTARGFMSPKEREREFRKRKSVRLCVECNEPQFETPSGVTCKNGHGGVGSVEK
jgi:hypothetical protein